MEPYTGSKVLYPSFNSPLPLPVQNPDGSPSVSITIACSWLPYVRGALYQLTQQWSWPQDDPAALLLAQNQAMTLISMFVECDTPIPPISCGYSFDIGAGAWTLVPDCDCGEYVSGIGFMATSALGGDVEVTIRHDLTTPNTITTIQAIATSDIAGVGADNQLAIYVIVAGTPTRLDGVTVSPGTNVVTWHGSVDDVEQIRIDLNTGSASGNAYITHASYSGLSDFGCE